MTTDKIKEMVDELVKKGEMSEKEARETFEELKEKSKQTRAEWEARIDNAIQNVLKRMDIPTHTELEELRERLAKLEQAKKAEN
jgi:polyhydroxyalkanoate synthesis regulator phasin